MVQSVPVTSGRIARGPVTVARNTLGQRESRTVQARDSTRQDPGSGEGAWPGTAAAVPATDLGPSHPLACGGVSLYIPGLQTTQYSAQGHML